MGTSGRASLTSSGGSGKSPSLESEEDGREQQEGGSEFSDQTLINGFLQLHPMMISNFRA